MTATIKFPNYEMAKQFAVEWSRKSLIGYSISSKNFDGSTTVTVDQVTEELKDWIDQKVKSLNAP